VMRYFILNRSSWVISPHRSVLACPTPSWRTVKLVTRPYNEISQAGCTRWMSLAARAFWIAAAHARVLALLPSQPFRRRERTNLGTVPVTNHDAYEPVRQQTSCVLTRRSFHSIVSWPDLFRCKLFAPPARTNPDTPQELPHPTTDMGSLATAP